MSKDLNILIRKCQDNDRAAQSEVYKMFSSTLFAVCLRYSKNYEDAQDTFQEGFITIFNKIKLYRFEGSFEGWLKRIMVNVCIAKHRNKNYLYVVNEEITSDTVDVSDEVSSHEETDDNLKDLKDLTYNEILTFVQQLPDRYRQVFNLYVVDELSHQEIANLLQISVGTSKSNLSRAKEKLKELLKKNNNIRILSK